MPRIRCSNCGRTIEYADTEIGKEVSCVCQSHVLLTAPRNKYLFLTVLAVGCCVVGGSFAVWKIGRNGNSPSDTSSSPLASAALSAPIGMPEARAQIKQAPGPKSPQEVYSQVSPSVVTIRTFDERNQPETQGSGVILSPDGWIATNHHVIEGAKKALVYLQGGAIYEVTGVGPDNGRDDVALLKINAGSLPAAKLSGGPLPPVGSKVFAIGSPIGLSSTLSEGIISSIRAGDSIIQTSAAISHGSSGGPLLSEEGTVIGLTTFKLDGGENLNFAIASSRVSALFGSRADGSMRRLAGFDDVPQLSEKKLERSESWALRGVKRVAVSYDIDDYLKRAALNDAKFRADVEFRLAKSGVKTVAANDAGVDGLLSIELDGMDPGRGGATVPFSFRATLLRRVSTLDDLNRVGIAPVWQSLVEYGDVGVSRVSELQNESLKPVDEFISVWMNENR